MKTVLFTFESPVGTFWIHPEPAGRVQLRIDGHRLKTYSSPKVAARAVLEQTTGWEKWDLLQGVAVPATLSRWKRGQPVAARTSSTSKSKSRRADEQEMPAADPATYDN